MFKQNILILCISLIVVIFLGASPLIAGVATLSWYGPTTNEDGTRLTDLDGYNVYFGTASGSYSHAIDVGNVTRYTVANLTNGRTYYFAVTAYDTSGNKSRYSNEISKTIASTQTLTVNKGGTGTGTVTSSPAGINCGSDCTETYNAGAVVTLTASPHANSIFAGWSGGGCTGNGQCILTINAATNTTANFTVTTYSMSGPGTVTYSISGRVRTFGGSPIAGVTMTLSGTSNKTTTSDTYGNYKFTGLTNGTYKIRPGKSGYTFTPTSRTITIMGANVTGQAFTGTP